MTIIIPEVQVQDYRSAADSEPGGSDGPGDSAAARAAGAAGESETVPGWPWPVAGPGRRRVTRVALAAVARPTRRSEVTGTVVQVTELQCRMPVGPVQPLPVSREVSSNNL